MKSSDYAVSERCPLCDISKAAECFINLDLFLSSGERFGAVRAVLSDRCICFCPQVEGLEQ